MEDSVRLARNLKSRGSQDKFSARARHYVRPAAAADKSQSQAPDAEELVQSGAIVSAHGLKGEVRVMPFTDFVEERFFSPGTMYMENQAQGRTESGGYDKPPGTVSKVKIVAGREVTSKGRNDCIVKFKGINDRNAADALIGRRLYILASERPRLSDDNVGDGDDGFTLQTLKVCAWCCRRQVQMSGWLSTFSAALGAMTCSRCLFHRSPPPKERRSRREVPASTCLFRL